MLSKMGQEWGKETQCLAISLSAGFTGQLDPLPARTTQRAETRQAVAPLPTTLLHFQPPISRLTCWRTGHVWPRKRQRWPRRLVIPCTSKLCSLTRGPRARFCRSVFTAQVLKFCSSIKPGALMYVLFIIVCVGCTCMGAHVYHGIDVSPVYHCGGGAHVWEHMSIMELVLSFHLDMGSRD